MMKKITLLCFFTISIICVAQAQEKIKLNIVYIGNSITQGVRLADQKAECPPAQCSEWLREQPEVESVNYFNNGVSGKTTIDFLPATDSFFKKVCISADSLSQMPGTILFSIMLGTNDSAMKGPHGAPVGGSQYFTNIKAIIDELLYRYPTATFVLHQPTWYSLNTHNTSMYLSEGLERLHSYTAQLEKLVEQYAERCPGHVFMGDLDAYDHFEKNHLTLFTPEKGKAGTFYLHPNKQGAHELGVFWGKAILNVVKNIKPVQTKKKNRKK